MSEYAAPTVRHVVIGGPTQRDYEQQQRMQQGILDERRRRQQEYERERAALDAWRAETDENARQWQNYRARQLYDLIANEPDVVEAKQKLQSASFALNDATNDAQQAELALAALAQPTDKAEVAEWARQKAEQQAVVEGYQSIAAAAQEKYNRAHEDLERIEATAQERLARATLAERDKVLAAGRAECRELQRQLDEAVKQWDDKLQPLQRRLEVLGVRATIQTDRPAYDPDDPQLAPHWQRPQVA